MSVVNTSSIHFYVLLYHIKYISHTPLWFKKKQIIKAFVLKKAVTKKCLNGTKTHLLTNPLSQPHGLIVYSKLYDGLEN